MQRWPTPWELAKSLVKWFVAVAGFGLALAGTYYGLDAAGVAWLFWAVVLVGATAALLVVGLPLTFRAWTILKNQGPLLQRAADLESEVDDQKAEIRKLRAAVRDANEAGRSEGISEALGALRAAYEKEIPQLHYCINEMGGLMLVGQVEAGASATIGARYAVMLEATGASIGVVEVTAFEPDRSRARLEIVGQDAMGVWNRLTEQATTGLEPADGLVLERFRLAEGLESARSLTSPPLGEMELEDDEH